MRHRYRRFVWPAAASVIATLALAAYAVVGFFPAWLPAQPTIAVGAYGGWQTLDLHRAQTMSPVLNLATTPPMGWNGFNHFYLHVSASTVEAEARALASSGMEAAGYTYVNVDGGWDMPTRDVNGLLRPMPSRFPDGIKPVADYVHSLGLKFGIYTSAGLRNCAGTSAGSYGHYRQDALTFASWGVDYVKLDWCAVPFSDYRHMPRQQVSQMLAVHMRDALGAAGRPMVLDLNAPSQDVPWAWARGLAQMWRTGKDSHDNYGSLVWNFHQNVGRYQWAGPGRWNDPDMLEIGNGGMTVDEYRTQFSLWAEMAAPLIAGNDLVTMSPVIQSILTNRAVIAVDQDPLGGQAQPISSADRHWVLVKPLANGSRAVTLFNETDKPAVISTTTSQLGLAQGFMYRLTNVWAGAAEETSGEVTATVAPHAVVMYVVTRA